MLSKKLDKSGKYLINQSIKEFIESRAIENKRWTETLLALELVKNDKVVEATEIMGWLKTWGSENKKSPPKI